MKLSRRFEAIGFIGAGRTGTALALAMSRAGYSVTAVASRSPESAQALAARIPGCGWVPDLRMVVESCDLVFLTVPDDAIAPVAAALPWRAGQAVVHCSGALSLDVLEAARERGAQVGGLHPFQTFPAGQDAAEWLPGSTFAIEASGDLALWLSEVVHRIGGQAITLRGEDKSLYHASALMSCAFLTTLLDTAHGLWEEIGFSRQEALEGLLPLAKGTLRSIEALGTRAAATGPVMRGDIGTLRRHIVSLEERAPWAVPLYRQAALVMVGMALKEGAITEEQAHEMERVLKDTTAVEAEPSFAGSDRDRMGG